MRGCYVTYALVIMNNAAEIKRAKLIREACKSLRGARSARIARLWVCAILADHLHAFYCCSLELAVRVAIDTLQSDTTEERTSELRRESVRRTVLRLRNNEVPRIKLSPALVSLAAAEFAKRQKKTEFLRQFEVP